MNQLLADLRNSHEVENIKIISCNILFDAAGQTWKVKRRVNSQMKNEGFDLDMLVEGLWWAAGNHNSFSQIMDNINQVCDEIQEEAFMTEGDASDETRPFIVTLQGGE